MYRISTDARFIKKSMANRKKKLYLYLKAIRTVFNDSFLNFLVSIVSHHLE